MRALPRAVLVDEQGDIVFFSGRTGNIWSRPRQGQLERHAMARKARYDLATPSKSAAEKETSRRDIKVGSARRTIRGSRGAATR